MSEILKLRKANAVIYSQLQQMTEERDEYKRAMEGILRVLHELRTRMRPVTQRGKARPRWNERKDA